MSSPCPDVCTFFIFTTLNIKDFAALNVLDLLALVFENLPPIAVGTGDTEVVVSTIADNVQSIVVLTIFNGLGLVIEVPDLCLERVWSLDHWFVANSVQISL